MSLKQKTISGTVWSTVARALTQAVQFGVLVALVRLLAPEDFGHLAMAMVFVGFAQILNKFGFGAAIVQRQTIDDSHISSAFWLNLVFGLCLLGGFYVLAPYIARFYGEPIIEPLVQVLGVLFIIAALGIVPYALLQRAMTFDVIAKVEVTSVLISGGLAIGLALRGWGVWSLVVQRLSKQAMRTLFSWMFVENRPSSHFSMSSVRDLLGFSVGYSGFSLINYWARKSDDLLIGRFISSYGLGVYDRAYRLMLFPIKQIITTISRVMFPALSKIQHDAERVKRIYLRAMGVLALLIFPLMMGLFVVSESFVLVLFGERWAEVAPVLEILCLVAIIQTICNPTGWIYKSQGRTDWMFWWGLGASGTIITAISVSVTFGSVQSVAIAYLIANIVLVYPCVTIPGKLIGMTFWEVVRAIASPFLGASLMALTVWSLSQFMGPAWLPWQRLALLVAAGALSYGVYISGAKPAAYRNVRGLIQEQLSERSSV